MFICQFTCDSIDDNICDPISTTCVLIQPYTRSIALVVFMYICIICISHQLSVNYVTSHIYVNVNMAASLVTTVHGGLASHSHCTLHWLEIIQLPFSIRIWRFLFRVRVGSESQRQNSEMFIATFNYYLVSCVCDQCKHNESYWPLLQSQFLFLFLPHYSMPWTELSLTIYVCTVYLFAHQLYNDSSVLQ